MTNDIGQINYLNGMMQDFRFVFAGALVTLGFVLVGCATAPPPPEQVSIFADVLNKPPKLSEIQKIDEPERKRVAILLTRNTHNNTRHLVDSLETFNNFHRKNPLPDTTESRAIKEAIRNSLNPEYPLAWVSAELKKRFLSVSLISDVKEFDSRFDYLALLDVFYAGIKLSSGDIETGAKIQTVFLNREWEVVDASIGSRKSLFTGWGLNSTAQHMIAKFNQDRETLDLALSDWAKSLPASNKSNPAGKTPETDRCLESAMKASNKDIRARAIAACGE